MTRSINATKVHINIYSCQQNLSTFLVRIIQEMVNGNSPHTHCGPIFNLYNDQPLTFPNLVPRVFSAFKMTTRRRPWRTAGHVTTKLANREPAAILKQSKSPIFLETRDLMFSRPPAILKVEMALGTRLDFSKHAAGSRFRSPDLLLYSEFQLMDYFSGSMS